MAKRRHTLSDLLIAGKYQQLLAESYDDGSPFSGHAEAGYVIGALTFQGRLEEAESLLESRKETFSPPQLLRAKFFLSLALCRQGEFQRAAVILGETFRARRRTGSHEDKFFLWQGLGFQRYMNGRYREAYTCAKRALEHAVAASFPYGRVLANDLFGHAQVQTGAISRGLATLEVAKKLASRTGSPGVAEAIGAALLVYRARFGLLPRAVSALQSAITELEHDDSYSKTELLLALSNVHRLQGNVSQAKAVLADACRAACASNNVPQRVLANIQLADLVYCQGDYDFAVSLARKSAELARSYGNPDLELRARGMEIKARRVKGTQGDSPSDLAELETLTRRSGSYLGRRILRRWKQPFRRATFDVGEDPVGDLFDLTDSPEDRSHATLEILGTPYLGLLPACLQAEGREPYLFVELVPGELLVLDKGDVERCLGVTPMTRRLCEEIATGSRSKEELALRLLPGNYHPLRHDPLLYSLVSKVRKTLRGKAHWLETSQDGYRFAPQVRVRFAAAATPPEEEPSSAEKTLETFSPPGGHGLNQRQMTLLHELRTRDFVDVRELVSRFRVSDATAQRDLQSLCEQGLLTKIGRGRATSYHLSRRQRASGTTGPLAE